MLGAEPMTVPHSGIQYAQPSSWKEPGGIFRLAASACVVMPIAAQTPLWSQLFERLSCCTPVAGTRFQRAHKSNKQDRCCATKKLDRTRAARLISGSAFLAAQCGSCGQAAP
jgi:hypothetical protein